MEDGWIDIAWGGAAWPPIVFGAGAGTIAGSFLATLLIRWPQGQSVMTGRSRCDACGGALRPAELIPLLSFILARGRCRRCAAPIDWRHPAMEAAAALIGAIAFAAHPMPLAMVSALLGWWLLILAALDLEHHWLPDRLTWPLVPAGLAAGAFAFGPSLTERVIGAMVGWLALAAIAFGYQRLRHREGVGGGDPKLLAGLGAWLGWQALPLVLIGAGLAGLSSLAFRAARGEAVSAGDRLPLGTLMAIAAWPLWLVLAQPAP